MIKNLINDIKDITTHHNIQPLPNKPDNIDAAACPTCGQGALPRIDKEHFTKEFSSKWVEKGLRNTFIGLLIAPGRHIYKYINISRDDLIRPVAYLLMTLAVFLWTTTHYPSPNVSGTQKTLMDYIDNNLQYIQLFQAAIVAGVMFKWTYRDRGYNIYEYATLMTYLLAQCLIASSLAVFLEHFYPDAYITLIKSVLCYLYCSWGIAQFLGGKTWFDYVRAALTYGVGFFIVACIMLVIILVWIVLTNNINLQ